MEIECPKCETCIDADPELCDGQTEQFEISCPKCGVEIVYDIEFDPIPCKVMELPQCKFIDCEYGSSVEIGRYPKVKCIYCGQYKIINTDLCT